MAESNKRSHVSGFVKNLRENLGQKVVTFRVAKRRFILPGKSTFATAIRVADLCEWNVLVLFEADEGAHPRITGIIERPLWSQVQAASEGKPFDDVKALCPEGRPL